MTNPWTGTPRERQLTDADFAAAARRLDCEPAAIRAVWEVEAAGLCFLSDGSVVRRFEPHHFPAQFWDEIGFYPRQGEQPWRASLRLSSDRMLRTAYSIDPRAALRASSWGAPQIMGFNAGGAGFATALEMVLAMSVSARAHLDAFVRLIQSWGIATTLRARDWQAFARRYNGSGQVAEYARRMEAAYRRHSGGRASPEVLRVGDRGRAVEELQRALGIEVDGVFGPTTHSAVMTFQEMAGLHMDGVVGARTWTALASRTDARPPAQPTPADARADLAAQVSGGAAAVTAAGGAMGVIRENIPDEIYTTLIWVGVALAAAYAARLLWRRHKGRVKL